MKLYNIQHHTTLFIQYKFTGCVQFHNSFLERFLIHKAADNIHILFIVFKKKDLEEWQKKLKVSVSRGNQLKPALIKEKDR